MKFDRKNYHFLHQRNRNHPQPKKRGANNLKWGQILFKDTGFFIKQNKKSVKSLNLQLKILNLTEKLSFSFPDTSESSPALKKEEQTT